VLSLGYAIGKTIDGLFFMLPVLVNFLLVLVAGVGANTSIFLPQEHGRAISMAMLFSLVVVAIFNSAVARIG
jgi:hypothetical protein